MESNKIILEENQIYPEYEAEQGSERKASKRRPKSKLAVGKVNIINMNTETMEIDFIGFHCSLINAYRRIILAEVPTVAIEKVYMYNNTSIVQDEVLAHRLGLIPLSVDPRLFEFRSKSVGTDDWGPQDSIKYKLKVKCTKQPGANSNLTSDLDTLYKNRKVLSSSLEWQPIGNQSDLFSKPLPPLHDDILIAKLNPGQEIELEAYAVKSVGSDHAKFQPGIAWYRLLPQIELSKEFKGKDAELLQSCFSPGVIEVNTNRKGEKVASVKDARYDSCSRNVHLHDQFKGGVKLTRQTDHFIFTIESQSFLKPYEMLEESVSIMINKCNVLLTEMNQYLDD